MTESYLTADEIAQELRISGDSVREWCRTGKLKALKAGRQWRIKRSDLEVFLKQTEVKQENDPKVNGPASFTARPFLVAL